RPAGPPPSYPPPPVPGLSPRQDSIPVFHKGLPPPIPPVHRNPSSPLPKKPPPSAPPPSILKDPRGPPPPLPYAPHLEKSSTPPHPPPPNAKRTIQGRAAPVVQSGTDKRDRRSMPGVTIQTPAICNQFGSLMGLNGPAHRTFKKPSPPPQSNIGLRPAMLDSPSLSKTFSSHPPPPNHPPISPLLKTGQFTKPEIPKPPPPTLKPPLPAAKNKQQGTKIQRASPDGQSFRSSGDEAPSEFRRKLGSSKHSGGCESDDDYENVQIPDSVFIDTTETSVIENLFRQSAVHPQDGLYCIRNSGTKTSKVLVVWDISTGKARNYRLFQEEDSVYLDSEAPFPTLSAVIEHYYSHPLPHHGSLCLQKPFTKTLGL
ncbi:hypothetical protein NQZ68_030755, partial [Dissostichus eleginoides]